jgi:hypothetical protein|tara:strand:- start:57 stop:227 length:171 start_codon:yes stop_codon:yes gene_type:complete
MIESAQYIEDKNGNQTGINAVFTGEGRLDVPLDPANRHYAAILEWVAEGNTIQEAD